MIEATEVLERFALLTDTPAAEVQHLLALAQLCAGRLLARLKPDADTESEENRQALITAAAGMLLYQNALLAQAGACNDFRLGDLSITAGNVNLAGIKALRDELLAGAAALLLPEGAFLLQVEPEEQEAAE